MRAFTPPAGVTVVYEPGFEYRLDNIYKGMMDYPVPYRRSRYQAAFRFIYPESMIIAGNVAVAYQFFLERE